MSQMRPTDLSDMQLPLSLKKALGHLQTATSEYGRSESEHKFAKHIYQSAAHRLTRNRPLSKRFVRSVDQWLSPIELTDPRLNSIELTHPKVSSLLASLRISTSLIQDYLVVTSFMSPKEYELDELTQSWILSGRFGVKLYEFLDLHRCDFQHTSPRSAADVIRQSRHPNFEPFLIAWQKVFGSQLTPVTFDRLFAEELTEARSEHPDLSNPALLALICEVGAPL